MSDFDRPPTQDTDGSAEVARTAQDKAAEGAGLVGEKTTDVARTAKEQAANTVAEATTEGRNLLEELREQVQEQSRSQARQLAGNVRRLADELHDMSENGKPGSTAAAVVRQVADGGRQAAAHLRTAAPRASSRTCATSPAAGPHCSWRARLPPASRQPAWARGYPLPAPVPRA